MQERMRLTLALGMLLISAIVAVNLLLENAPVVIQLEEDTFRVIDIPYVYTVKEAYILLFSGFFGGVALSRLLASSGLPFFGPSFFRVGEIQDTGNLAENVVGNIISGVNPPFYPEGIQFKEFEPRAGMSEHDPESGKARPDPTFVLLRALEGDERKAVELIVESGGRILQNELVNSLNFSRAKVSRILANLERRGIISKKKYGLTNCISIADVIKGRNCPEGLPDEE